MMHEDAYRSLARRLDSLPNGFPPTEDGSDLRLLAKLFTPEEAELAAQLSQTLETSEQVATKTGTEPDKTRALLKGMARKGLVRCSRVEKGVGFGLMPFVVGFYEMQVAHMDRELAQLFEAYYQRGAPALFGVAPQFHRVIPVAETVKHDLEIRPYESISEIIGKAKAWGVLDCICRKQKALIGDPCNHPVDVCMALSDVPGVFEHNETIRSLTLEEAHATLKRAAEAGLVHSVSNNKEGISYICNCCTCSCGILRGMVELGIANVVAKSTFVNTVNEDLCLGCETCVDYCQFQAIKIDRVAFVDVNRCTGCGVCVTHCPENALGLVSRPEADLVTIPKNEMDWIDLRARARGLEILDRS